MRVRLASAIFCGKLLKRDSVKPINYTVRFATTHFGFQEVDENEKSRKGKKFKEL